MSLDKAIKYKKERRKQYRGAKAIDGTCRNHGSDDWAKDNRLYQINKELERMSKNIKEYQEGEMMGEDLIIEYMDGKVENIYVDDVSVKDGVLYYYIRFGIKAGKYGVPLVNIKKYKVGR